LRDARVASLSLGSSEPGAINVAAREKEEEKDREKEREREREREREAAKKRT